MGIRVLLVDDEKDLTAYLAKRLAARGMEVETASDGASALQAVQRSIPDVVVLDMLMPGMDGIQTLGALHERHPDLPVIILSGHGAEEQAARGARLGAIDYLHKPCDLQQLVDAITGAVTAGSTPASSDRRRH